MPAIHQAGRTLLRNAAKTLISHVGISTDATAFGDGQTVLDPANVGAGNNLIRAATIVDVDGDTFDATLDVDNRDASADFQDKAVSTIGAQTGIARTNNLGRVVRTQTIGLQDGDFATIGVRFGIEDNSV